MLHKTRGIVLHTAAYSDRYGIALIYTEQFGRVSYLTVRAASRRSKTPRSLFQPLSPLDMAVEHLPNRDIHKIVEARPLFPLTSTTSNPVKSAIAIFMAELLSKVVREEHANTELFAYLIQSINILELTEQSCANFHLAFMTGLGRFLGLYPDASTYAPDSFFDLQNGIFTSVRPLHPHFLEKDESRSFSMFLRMNYGNMAVFRFSGAERRDIIRRILDYYRLHLANFSDIKSIDVLHAVFDTLR